VTYWPQQANNFIENAKNPISVAQVYGTARPLTIVGDFQANRAPLAHGSSSISSRPEKRLTPVQRQSLCNSWAPPARESFTPIGTTAVPNIILLPDTNLKLRLVFAAAANGPLPPPAFERNKTAEKRGIDRGRTKAANGFRISRVERGVLRPMASYR
jgi:hypothetical protein